jgi:polyene glycosyltransferase
VGSGVGLAVHDPNAITGEELAGRLTRLLTETTFTERAGCWSSRVRAAGGTTRAAGLVLGLSTPAR